MGSKWQRGEVRFRRGREKARRKMQQSSRGDEVWCRVGQVASRDGDIRFVSGAEWSRMGMRWEFQGATMHQGPENRRRRWHGSMGFGRLQSAEVQSWGGGGAEGACQKVGRQSSRAKPILLSSLFLCRCPRGRLLWQSEFAGPGRVRDSGLRRGWVDGGDAETKRETGCPGRPKYPSTSRSRIL